MSRLVRDERNAMWTGCLAAVADQLDVDPAIMRIGYCLFTIISGFGIGFIIYLILMLCIPSPEDL
jgi:phage shock protein C